MMEPQTQPKPCNDTDCRGHHSPRERIALAESICEKRGERMTQVRRRVLKLLWENTRPMGAYELIEAIRVEGSRPVGPPTVYRALDFLMDQSFVTKIESLNAFVPCAHPERDHDCLFFICNGCRASIEIEDPRIGGMLAEDASALGFVATHRTIEIEGLCARCSETSVT